MPLDTQSDAGRIVDAVYEKLAPLIDRLEARIRALEQGAKEAGVSVSGSSEQVRPYGLLRLVEEYNELHGTNHPDIEHVIDDIVVAGINHTDSDMRKAIHSIASAEVDVAIESHNDSEPHGGVDSHEVESIIDDYDFDEIIASWFSRKNITVNDIDDFEDNVRSVIKDAL